MIIGNRTFNVNDDWFIMGILNLSNDSFYDGGKNSSIDKILLNCEAMINDGVDIVDIGAQSTKPGYIEIPASQESEIVCKALTQIKQRFDIPISIDTYKYQVAANAIDLSADMINNINGFLTPKDKIAKLVADKGVACCLMHKQGHYQASSFLKDVIEGLNLNYKNALEAGIDKDKIILDPGIGFSDNTDYDLDVIKHMDNIVDNIDVPLLIGASNKSFLGKSYNLDIDNRVEASVKIAVKTAKCGARFFRVHNIKEHKLALDKLKAL